MGKGVRRSRPCEGPLARLMIAVSKRARQMSYNGEMEGLVQLDGLSRRKFRIQSIERRFYAIRTRIRET